MPLPDYGEETGYWDQVAQHAGPAPSPPGTASRVSNLRTDYPYLSPGVTYAAAATEDDGRELARMELKSILARQDTMPGEQATNRRGRVDKAIRRISKYRDLLDQYLVDKEHIDKAIHLAQNHEGPMTPEVDKARQTYAKYFDVLHTVGRDEEARATLDGILAAGPRQVRKADRWLKDAVAGLTPKDTSGLEVFTAGFGGAAFVGNQLSQLASKTSFTVGGERFDPLGGGIKAAAEVAQAGYQAGSALNRSLQAHLSDPAGLTSIGDVPGEVAQQTALAQAVLHGKSLGGGILPDPNSEAGRAAVDAAIRYSPNTYAGEAWTPGRSFADIVSTPGTTEFSVLSGGVDATLAIVADPANIVLSRLAAARAAGKTLMTPNAEQLAEAGGYAGLSKATVGVKPTAHWEGAGQTFVKGAAEETNAANIWLAADRKIPVSLAEQMARTNDPQEITRLLIEKSGTDITNPLTKWQVKPGGRWATYTPSGYIDFRKPDEAVTEAERYMVNARVPFEDRQQVLDQFIKATAGPQRFNAIDEMMNVVKTGVIANGEIDPARLDELTKIWQRDENNVSHYWVDAVTGRDALHPMQVTLDGAVHAAPQPHLIAETLAKPVRLPDWRAIRDATSPYSDLVDNKLWGAATGAGDQLMGVWRPAVILRPAFMVRVVGDEQMRLAAEGLPNVFTHPIQLISEMLGKRSSADVFGEAFDVTTNAEYATSQYAGGMHLKGPTQELTHYTLVNADHAQFPRGVVEEIARVGNDPAMRAALDMGPDDVFTWLTEGEGKSVRGLINQMDSRYADPNELRRYVDSLYTRIDDLTQGDAGLLDMLRTQKVGDVPIWDAERGRATPEALSATDTIRNEGHGPQWVKVSNRLMRTESEKGHLGKAVDYLFEHILTKPSNAASRGPTYRNAYWDRVEQVFPELRADARAKLLDEVGNAGIGDDAVQRLRNLDKGMKDAEIVGKGTLEDAHLLANSHALDETKALLYDLTNKSQWSDAARLIAPFGEAWREVMTTWLKLVNEHPNIIRRAEQAAIAARDSEVDPITGLPRAGGVGFFHPDQFGKMVFTYPGSGILTDKILGVPIPLQGSVAGLNMLGQGLPGVGPAVSIPAAWFLPNKPSLDKVKELIFPFGLPDEGSPIDDITGSLTAGWLKRINEAFADPNSSRQYANATLDIAKYLASTGDYDLRGADPASETRRLLNDARYKAGHFYLIHGIAQAMAPSSPQPEFLVKDKSGRLLLAATIADDYRKKADKVGFDAAFEWLLDRYGPDNFLIPQEKSEAKTQGLTSTDDQYDWARTHPDIIAKYPQTWALFAPQSGTFDFAAYQAEFQRGDREGLTPQQMLDKANKWLASFIYFRARDGMGAKQTPRQESYLRELKTDLQAQFPGYTGQPENPGKTSVLVGQLQDAVLDPTVLRTPIGRALNRYMTARQDAINKSKRIGLAGPWQAQKAVGLRNYLRGVADDLIDETPGFSAVWDSVLQREFKD